MNLAEPEEMARLLPSPGDPVLPPERLIQLEAHLMREITQEVPNRNARTSRALSRQRGRFAAVALPLGTAATVLAAVLTFSNGESERPSGDADAVELLNRIAAVAAAQDAPAARNDQYVFTLTQGTQEIMDEGRDTFRRSDWHAVDGKRDGLAKITVLSGPSGRGTKDMTLQADPHHATLRELQALPTDTDKLYARVWAATKSEGPTHEQAALELIGSMLQDAALLPKVDAALYRVAARIPGVTLVERAEDVAGRPGLGLAFGDGDDRDVWVFDEADLKYLGSNEVALLDVGIVDKVGETPAS
ncbi:CU044_5270 family protein [Streptomyces sp. NPDC001675]